MIEIATGDSIGKMKAKFNIVQQFRNTTSFCINAWQRVASNIDSEFLLHGMFISLSFFDSCQLSRSLWQQSYIKIGLYILIVHITL